MARQLGELVARGTRSVILAYGRDAVVKVPEPSTPAAWIHAEGEYAEAARHAGAPVPRLLGIEEIAGRPASVWERVYGPSLWELVASEPECAVEIGRMLADVQRRLFELVPPATLPRQQHRVVTKIRKTAAMLDPALIRALEAVPASSRGPHLCHGDLHPSNVLLSSGGAMIVDWFDASCGDPVADIARTLMTMLGDQAATPLHLPGSTPQTLRTLTDAYLASVIEALAIDDDELERWQAVQAVARVSEGVPRAPLLEVWHRFEAADRSSAAQAAAS